MLGDYAQLRSLRICMNTLFIQLNIEIFGRSSALLLTILIFKEKLNFANRYAKSF